MNKHVRLALFRSAVGIIIGVGLILITVVRATTPSAFELNWATIDGSGGTSSGGTTL